jgi:hypothetical protein
MDDEVVLAPRGTKGRPQVKRERANRLIAALVIEAQQINNDPLPWYDVTRLSVFGSYLSLKPVLGDLDIAVRTTPRWRPDSGGFTRAWQSFPRDCPAPKAIARDQLSLIHWPRLYVLKRLKRLGRGISVHSQEDLDSCSFDFEVIFEKSEDDLLFVK